MKTDTVPNRQPLILLRNVSYPTFQLYAIAGKGRNTPPDDVLKIAILETMKWLRQRFRDFEIPGKLKLPEPEAYETISLASLDSFYLDMGYKLQIVWLEDAKIWTLRLTEPDLGANPGAADQKRKPVPGRLFETNISYNRIDGGVECGFRTIVHEPKGTDASCEVFRLAVVKYLARHPKVGLWQTWQLSDEAHVLSESAEIRRFKHWIFDESRMMPAIVFGEYRTSSAEMPVSSLGMSEEPIFDPDRNLERKLAIPVFARATEPSIAFDDKPLSRYRMGYAQFFILPASMRKEYVDVIGQPFENGDIRILEPFAFGGNVTVIPCLRWICERQAVLDELDEFVQNYTMRKPMAFGKCLFVPDAQEREREAVIRLHRSKADMALAYQKQKAETERRGHIREAEFSEELHTRDKTIIRLKEDREKLACENKKLCDDFRSTECKYRSELERLSMKLKHLEFCQTHPKKPSDVAAWVEHSFPGRLIFHERARGLMGGVQSGEVDLALLCEALEFLASEYRDLVIGLSSETELDHICSIKYGRPFCVSSTVSPSADEYYQDYYIKYRSGSGGVLEDRLMDFHLKVGNKADNLLRIYFLYDKERELIVVGSLPKHLRTRSYQ